MLNFNSINKTDKDIILSHNKPFKYIMTSIRDDNDELFNKYKDDVDPSLDGCLLIKYAAMLGRKRMMRVLLKKTYTVDRAALLCSILTGGKLDMLELFGDIDVKDDLSGEALAIAACKGHTYFFKKYLPLVDASEIEEYNLVSIAARNKSNDIVDFLVEQFHYEYNEYDALVSSASANNAYALGGILSQMQYNGNGEEAIVDASIVAATYGNFECLETLLSYVDPYFINFKDNAIIKAAVNSESIDTVMLVIDSGADLAFDDGVILAIASQQNDNNKKLGGNLELFKVVYEHVNDNNALSLARKTAEAYARTDIVDFIDSIDIK